MTQDEFSRLDFEDFDEALLCLAHDHKRQVIPAILVVYINPDDIENVSANDIGSLIYASREVGLSLEARLEFVERALAYAEILRRALLDGYPETDDKDTH